MPPPLDPNDVPDNQDGFKTSRARYEFNIDRLAQKYGAMPPSGVEVDLNTFDMHGTDKAVKKEFKRLAEVGEKFSFATMSSPVVNAAELESTQLAAKCLVLNDIFRSQHQGSLGLPAPPVRPALLAPGAAAVSSPVTRARSRAMIEDDPAASSVRGAAPEGSGRGGGVMGGRGGGGARGGMLAGAGMDDGTPVRPGAGGGRKSGGGGMAVAARAGRTMVAASGAVRRPAAMMIEDDEPEAASGIVARAQTVAGAMMAGAVAAPDARQDGAANAPAAMRRTPRAPTMVDDVDDAGSGYGGGGRRTPPNLIAIVEPVSSRTRQRTKITLGAATPARAIGAAPVRAAIAAAPAAPATAPAAAKAAPKATATRRLTMPQKQQQQADDKGETPKRGGGGGRKPAAARGGATKKNTTAAKKEEKAEEGKKKERKRASAEPAKDVPKKQARLARPAVPAVQPAAAAPAPTRAAAPAATPARQAVATPARAAPAAAAGFLAVKREREASDDAQQHGGAPRQAAAAAPAAGGGNSDGSSIEFVAHVYRDPNSGRELVCPPESKDHKNDRIDSWLEDSFNRTMSEYSSQDDSAGPSTSTASATPVGDFEKDKDVEGFDKHMRRLSSAARSRNSNMRMGMVPYSGQRRASASNGPPAPK